MRPSEIKIKIEEAKKKKQKLEAEKQEKEKRNLIGKIAGEQQGKLIQKQKTVSFDKKKKVLLGVASSGIAASVIIASLVYIGSIYMNRVKYIVAGDKNRADSVILQDSSTEFCEVDRYLKNVVSENGETDKSLYGKFCSEKTAPVLRTECIKALAFIRNRDFKISSVQLDRSSGYYYVMCDFNDKGSYYFTIEKQDDDFLLVSVDFFS